MMIDIENVFGKHYIINTDQILYIETEKDGENRIFLVIHWINGCTNKLSVLISEKTFKEFLDCGFDKGVETTINKSYNNDEIIKLNSISFSKS